MVYFKCIICDIKRSKLDDYGCPTCASPCQVIESSPSPGWIREEHIEGPLATFPGQSGESQLAHMEDNGPCYDLVTQSLTASPSSSVQNQDEAAASDEDNVLVMGRGDLRRDTRVPSEMYMSNNDLEDGFPLSEENSDGESEYLLSRRFPALSSCRGVRSESLFARAEEEATKKQPQGIHATSRFSEAGTQQMSTLTVKPRDTQQGSAAKGGKKKAKKAQKKKGNNPSSAPVKVAAQLELPDPVPLPVLRNAQAEWNDVARRRTSKVDKKIQKNAAGRINARENVNASSYLFRANENAKPHREGTALGVRFSIGNAKHDVRRVIPRNLLE